jgi:hypothetical protein
VDLEIVSLGEDLPLKTREGHPVAPLKIAHPRLTLGDLGL